MGEIVPQSKAHTPVTQRTTHEQKIAIRADMTVLEEAMEKHPDKFDLYGQAIHHFADGMYARELFMPAGTVATSLVHKTDHFCFVLYGECDVADEGIGVHRIKGPCMLKTTAGTKRALNIITDSLWVGVYVNPDNITDIDELVGNLTSTGYLQPLDDEE